MNLNQIVSKDSGRIQSSKKFVVSTLSHMIQKPFYPLGPDDGKDHTESYLRKLKDRSRLRVK